ncbi:hypothetical protein [Flavobacterium phragmitis]|uniref:Uncharacterized protein n=1 Tax=Flavobacterium phragmitis TaxID=739143 RepID=A0A1I1WGR4_9FLAO|nr:hypothetical protein [Flavobacterium phragmitis]SFD94191.1 hypothetical protein SAMN05216297_11551 [Flavobacterium phragmitis]
MSTNHNRIKVADLETNQPNKILKTNQNGELEFSDTNNLQTENYNGLDYTEEGKALDARQGKVLKDMMDNEYMKLSGNQTFSGVKTATNTSYPQNAGIVINNTSENSSVKSIVLFSNSGTGLLSDNAKGTGVFAQTTSGSAGHFYCNGNGKALYVHSVNSSDRTATIIGNTNNDNLYITNNGAGANVKSISTGTGLVFAGNNGYGNTSTISKDGDIKAKSMELGAVTDQKPSLILPNGTLTSTKQNGAIERDENGQLWETHSGVRSRLITTADNLILIPYKFPGGIEVYHESNISESKQFVTTSIMTGKIDNNSVQRLNVTTLTNCTLYDSDKKKPNIAKIEVFLRINNGLFANSSAGSGAVNQVKLMEYSGLNNYGYKNYQELIMFNTQNYEVSTSQWASIVFPQKTIIDGVTTTADKSYYLRDASNTRTFGASEASFSFVFVNTLGFEDATNGNGLNSKTLLRTNNYALFIETIR